MDKGLERFEEGAGFVPEVLEVVSLEEVRGFEVVECDHLLTVGIRPIGTALYVPICAGGSCDGAAVWSNEPRGDLVVGEVCGDRAANTVLDGIEEGVVFVTPNPIHASLPIRHHEGMSRLLGVLQGVLVLSLFAATNMTAGQAHAQRWPRFT